MRKILNLLFPKFFVLTLLIFGACEVPKELRGEYPELGSRGLLTISKKSLYFESQEKGVPSIFSKGIANDSAEATHGFWSGKNSIYQSEFTRGEKTYETFIAFSNLNLVKEREVGNHTLARDFNGDSLAFTREKGKAVKSFFVKLKKNHKYTIYYTPYNKETRVFLGAADKTHSLLFSREETTYFDEVSEDFLTEGSEFELDLSTHD